MLRFCWYQCTNYCWLISQSVPQPRNYLWGGIPWSLSLKNEFEITVSVLNKPGGNLKSYILLFCSQAHGVLGCNKRTGWAEFFSLLHEKRVQGGGKIFLLHEKWDQGGAKTSK